MKVGLVTDSLSDLTQDLYKKNDIRMVPLNILFDETNYKDVLDLSPMQFYEMQAQSKVLPRTNQPIPHDFEQVYRPMSKEFDHIFSLHVASAMSGTISSAEIAARQVNEEMGKQVIEVIDTNQVCFGEGLVVLAAAKAIQDGKNIENIREEIKRVSSGMNTIFVPESLEYLRKNGRIGAASALLGGILNIKPMLEINGKVVPVEKIRGSRNIVPRMLEVMKSRTASGKKVIVCVYDALSKEMADELEALINAEYKVIEMYRGTVGPAVGCHCGPHTVALSWYEA